MSRFADTPQLSLAVITISGPDTSAFLQSQLTLDVEGIARGQLQPGAWCSPDGRVDAVLLVALDNEHATLVLPESLAANMFKRARMYSIGRKVEIAYGAEIRGCGPANGTGQRALSLSLDQERVLVFADRHDATTPPTDAWPLPTDWLRADIECRMPWILPETARMFLPQMLGLEALGGLSYRKGCFPGQEVIARVHYRGRVTRRISRFRLQSDRPPAPGTGFELVDTPACVLYAAASTDVHGTSDGLAVVAADADDEMAFSIADVAGVLVSR